MSLEELEDRELFDMLKECRPIITEEDVTKARPIWNEIRRREKDRELDINYLKPKRNWYG